MKAAILFALTTAIGTTAYAEETLTVGYFENQPWVIPQAGQGPKGAAVEYWESTVAPAIGVKIKWSGPTPMVRLLKQLESGEVDAVLILAKTAEREKLFLYPSAPYFKMRPGLAVAKAKPLSEIKAPADLAGLKIGYQQGGMLPPFMKDPAISFDLLASPTWLADNFAKASHGRVDAVYDNNVDSLKVEAARSGVIDQFKFLELPVPPQDIYSAFGSSPKGAGLVKKYNEVNDKNPGVTQSLLKKYAAK